MRTGGCTIQQALTTEAASVVKQAVTLARRRGHAQVTPLHVANTMLSSSSGLLRTACLQSHSHPLQCKALELCFNVALNRLPASTSSPMLGAHSPQQFPSISNALVAAFKRAQAHQRRGSIENQQQPVLAVKIELEQLIISILDDPSVSRVMREAGFSSTQVKSNVEQAVSLEICSQSAPSVTSKSSKDTNNGLALSNQPPTSSQASAKARKPFEDSLDPIFRNEDVISVIENLANNKSRRSFVIIGECLGSIEGVVKAVMEKVLKGDAPETLREVKFISVPVSSFGNLSRVAAEAKLEELEGLVRSHMGKGLVLNLGDLNWVIDHSASHTVSGEPGSTNWSSVEHLILELGKLACTIGENNSGRFWLMGIATFQTYMKCKSGHPLLNTVYGLHPLTIPAGILRLSLINDCDILEAQSTSGRAEKGSSNRILLVGGEEKQLSRYQLGCSAKFETQARSLQSSTRNGADFTSSTLPAWLRQYKNEKEAILVNDQDPVSIKDLCNKWNTVCSSIHREPYSSEKTPVFSSVSPSYSSTSAFSYEHQYPPSQTHQSYWSGSESLHKANNINEPPSGWRFYINPAERQDHSKQPFSLNNPNSTPNSTSSSDAMETDYFHKFKELNAQNLNMLCDALVKKVPWQKDIIPEIASTILKCRSGMIRRKGMVSNSGSRTPSTEAKEETWLFFQGVDVEAKEKIAKELARLVFGSHNNFVSIALSNFSSTRADSAEDCRNKRSRDEQSCSYIERFAEAVSSNPHRVFLVEDVEQADYHSQMGFKRAIERGRVADASGEEVGLVDAIVILSCESFSSRSRACSPSAKLKTSGPRDEQKEVGVITEEGNPFVSLDLNISIEEDGVEEQSIDDIGLLESVDGRIIFKILDF